MQIIRGSGQDDGSIFWPLTAVYQLETKNPPFIDEMFGAGSGSGSFFTSGSTFGGGQPSTNIFGTSTSGGTGLLSMGGSANRGVGFGGTSGIFSNSGSTGTGTTGIFGTGATSTGVFGGSTGGIFGSGNTGGASTPIFGGSVANSSTSFGAANQGPSFGVFAQGSPLFTGTQADKFILKKNKDDFEVICYTFMDKYNGIPLKMLRLQDYANIKEGRIMDEHKNSINKYFQTVKNMKGSTFTTGTATIGATLFNGGGSGFSKPASFGLGQSTGTAIGGGTGLFGGQGGGFGNSSNVFGAPATVAGGGSSTFATYGGSTSQSASGSTFGGTNAFGFSTSNTPATNAFGIGTASSTGGNLNAFGSQSTNTGGFGQIGAFGGGATATQPTTGFGMFSGNNSAGFGQFGTQQNSTGINAGMFNKPQGAMQTSVWGTQQQPQTFGQLTAQQPQYPAYGNPVVQSNLNALSAAAASATGSTVSKAPYALVYLPIETLSLKKDEPSKASHGQANKKTSDAVAGSYHATEEEPRGSRNSNYYAPLPALASKKPPLLGENPLAKLEARYGHVMAKKGEIPRSFINNPPASTRPKVFVGSERQVADKPTLRSPQSTVPVVGSPVAQSLFINEQQIHPKASPYFSSVSTKASPSSVPHSFLEIELASGRSIMLPVNNHDLLANVMRTLLDKEILPLAIQPEDMAFFKGSEKLQLTMPVEELNLLPREKISLKHLNKQLKSPQLPSAYLVPSIGPNYSCSPTIPAMAFLSEEELQEVYPFTIWNEWGRIQFLAPVDLRGLRLEHLIKIERRLIEIYPNDVDKPPRGQGLNLPTRIEFNHFGLVNDPSDTRSTQKIDKRIRTWATENQATLLSIDYQADMVVIQTEGLPETHDD